MSTIKIIIAGNNYLVKKGLQSLIAEHKDFRLAYEVETESSLIKCLALHEANVLIVDFSTIPFSPELIQQIKILNPSIQILAFNQAQPKYVLSKMLDQGITSYLMLHCDKEEITEAIYKTAKGERFLCGQIVEILMDNKKNEHIPICPVYSSCGGVSISEREVEIIRLIAEGHSNQIIADKLFLSIHTVNTHRKNIMGKLGISNTAGLVMYAIREQLISAN